MKVIIVGGAGFIGSHLTDRFMKDGHEVTVYDNFTSGKESHIAEHKGNPRFTLKRAGIQNVHTLKAAMAEQDLVIHLASNPDISRATIDPTVDFFEGTMLTQLVLEAMRVNEVKQLIYMSGSGVYGDLGYTYASEDHGPLIPTSTYGASKLAGEAMISAYCHLLGMQATCFRFANVVGPRQTHGVGLDFLKRLKADRTKLLILGDGKQSKSYIHVNDAVEAILMVGIRPVDDYDFSVFNVATPNAITVHEIAVMAVKTLGLNNVEFEYTGGSGGWKGDIPIVRLDTNRIRSLGWCSSLDSSGAMQMALQALKEEV